MPNKRGVEICAKHRPQRWRSTGVSAVAVSARSEMVRWMLDDVGRREVVGLVAVELEGSFGKGFSCVTLCVGPATVVCDGLVVEVVPGWSLMWFGGFGGMEGVGSGLEGLGE